MDWADGALLIVSGRTAESLRIVASLDHPADPVTEVDRLTGEGVSRARWGPGGRGTEERREHPSGG